MEEFTNGPDGVTVDWTAEPNFYFSTEIDALTTLQDLGEQLANARRQVDETMRYLRAAIVAARRPYKTGEQTSVEAIINHANLSRRTVYGVLDRAPRGETAEGR